MGYYSGNGVKVSEKVTPIFYGQEWVPTWTLDSQPMGFRLVQYTGKMKETTTKFSGVAEPTLGANDASITMSTGTSPHETASTTTSAVRIGDSNLWEKVVIQRTEVS